MENSFPTLFAVGLFLGLVIGYFGRRAWASRQASSIEEKVKSRLEEAEKKSKSVLLEAEDKAGSILAEAKKEEKEAKVQLEGLQDRLLHREEILDKKLVHKKRHGQIVRR